MMYILLPFNEFQFHVLKQWAVKDGNSLSQGSCKNFMCEVKDCIHDDSGKQNCIIKQVNFKVVSLTWLNLFCEFFLFPVELFQTK